MRCFFLSSLKQRTQKGWLRFVLCMLCVGLLLFVEVGCGGEVTPTGPCRDCPERCVQSEDGSFRCVECLKNAHCHEPERPTRECTQAYRCQCGSDADCANGRKCSKSGACVECLRSADCTNPLQPICLDGYCLACEPNKERACAPENVVICAMGIQRCEAGTWGRCRDAKVCSAKESCREGACECIAPRVRCGSECVLLEASTTDCGGCGNACKTGEFCASGRCVRDCPPVTPERCGDVCVRLQSSEAHCGRCGNACEGGQYCADGVCRCPHGQQLCAGRCVWVETERSHCGACGKMCQDGQVCAAGRCVTSCPSKTPDVCYGGCFDTQNHPGHCGRCGDACAPGQVCLQGSCHCPQGQLFCQGKCVDVALHPEHCGACGKTCQDGQQCAAGQCVASCPSKTPDVCYGGCVSLQTHSQHCGKCGHVCKEQESCLAGVCRTSQTTCGVGRPCAGALLCVNGVCVPPECDAANPCPTGKECQSGRCVEKTPTCDVANPCPTGQTCVAGECVVQGGCQSRADCVSGQVCQGGRCRACVDDGECRSDERCLSGACRLAKATGETCLQDVECQVGLSCIADLTRKKACWKPCDPIKSSTGCIAPLVCGLSQDKRNGGCMPQRSGGLSAGASCQPGLSQCRTELLCTDLGKGLGNRCYQLCDERALTCAGGASCLSVNHHPVGVCEIKSAKKGVGESCTAQSQCQSGLYCAGTPGSAKCVQPCDPLQSVCQAPEVCDIIVDYGNKVFQASFCGPLISGLSEGAKCTYTSSTSNCNTDLFCFPDLQQPPYGICARVCEPGGAPCPGGKVCILSPITKNGKYIYGCI